ncbi:hypothetical protein BP6252_13515 [Coleophoma cylindrospora]|uniref:ABC transporter domain-containing protein n=1 Tax=Coleophoma cylindrospora TaxID=1849047 RepID=A0A3D8Q9H3_9HELO|nr:hypothetical protein BP6252_13515 [Coleophoma cylindrospora]
MANSTCYQAGAIGLPIQTASSWTSTGCSQGFFCPNNTADALPEYCPPLPDCQVARLSGLTCEPQGVLEPVICTAGYYCPKGAKSMIKCPAGHYCPQGSYKPLLCGRGARCSAGSVQNMDFLPLVILIILDLILVSVVVLIGCGSRLKKWRPRQQKRANRKTYTFPGRLRGNNYQELEAFRVQGEEEADIAMEAAFAPPQRKRTGFEEIMEPEFNAEQELGDTGKLSSDLQLFVQSMSKCIGGEKFGLNFEYHDLKFQPDKSKKPVLSQVSGCINSGSLWGVMGASGAGKSTFVNVLMGKTPHTGGETKVNGVAGNMSRFKKIIGYVPQDDIVLPELTVRENILHSARIRLPYTWTETEIQNHVDILIRCLCLDHVQNSLVGSTAAPVISGGQRKRVSIGIELAASPSAIFLDEPTSGLDATSAASIMTTLKALSRLGITVVTIIHQPRQEIFDSLDSLVLLGAGRMIYQGPQIHMQPYFEQLGFTFPKHGNPADAMGDIIAGEGRLYKPHGDATVQGLIDNWQNFSAGRDQGGSSNISVVEMASLNATIKSRGARWYFQIYFCFIRSIVQQFRLQESFWFEMGTGAMAGGLIGLSEESQKGQNFRGIFNEPYSLLSSAIGYTSVPQMALLVGLAIGLTAAPSGVKIFGEEKLVYWREAAAGHNRFAYYMGKVISTIPRMVFANLHFTTIFFVLTTPRISWFAAFAANLLYFYCIYGLASCISMVCRRDDGPLLAVIASLIVGVLNGMSPTLARTSTWHVLWLWRATPGTWLAEAYFTENLQPLEYLYNIDDAVTSLGYHLGKYSLDMWVLLALGTAYRVLAFAGLRFMDRHKQR